MTSRKQRKINQEKRMEAVLSFVREYPSDAANRLQELEMEVWKWHHAAKIAAAELDRAYDRLEIAEKKLKE